MILAKLAAILLLALSPGTRATEGDQAGVDDVVPDPLPMGEPIKMTAKDYEGLETVEASSSIGAGPPVSRAKREGEEPAYHLRDNFHVKTKWPNCKSFDVIWNQGQCYTCFAVTAASVYTDRRCIADGGRTNIYMSASQIAGCSEPRPRKQDNCDLPGSPILAFELATRGVVSGGVNGSHQGCVPYEVPTSKTLPRKILPIKIGCETSCVKSFPLLGSSLDFTRETHATYGIWQRNTVLHALTTDAQVDARILEMKKEIVESGPLATDFAVYQAFRTWNFGAQGPYRYVHDPANPNPAGGHNLRILGWGVDRGVKYWLVANTWGKNWGDKNGFAWIAMATNVATVNLEAVVSAPTIYPLEVGESRDHKCSTADFCRLPIEQAVPTDPKDFGAPFYLFQQGCLQQVKRQGTGLVTVGAALPTRYIFQRRQPNTLAPPGKIVDYKIVPYGTSLRTFLYNEAALGRAYNRVTDSKFSVDTTVPSPAMGIAAPRATVVAGVNVQSWSWELSNPQFMKNPDVAGGGKAIGTLVTANFGTATALLHLDGERMGVFGNRAGAAMGNGRSVPLGILNYPGTKVNAQQDFVLGTAGTLECVA